MDQIHACKRILKFKRNFIINCIFGRNNGVCYQPKIGIYACNCPCGFTGYNCETRVYFCSQNTTYCNQGTCQESQPCSVSLKKLCICHSSSGNPCLGKLSMSKSILWFNLSIYH